MAWRVGDPRFFLVLVPTNRDRTVLSDIDDVATPGHPVRAQVAAMTRLEYGPCRDLVKFAFAFAFALSLPNPPERENNGHEGDGKPDE